VGQFILKRDDLKLGLVLGFLSPILGIIAFYLWKFSGFPFKEFLEKVGSNKQLISSLTVISLFLNVVLFTVYINTRKDKTAKGIFIITVIFAIVSLIFKFFG